MRIHRAPSPENKCVLFVVSRICRTSFDVNTSHIHYASEYHQGDGSACIKMGEIPGWAQVHDLRHTDSRYAV